MADLTVTPEQWLARAAEAEDQFDFDVCVARGLTFFGDIDRAEKAREGMFGRWRPGRAKAIAEGMRVYAEKRTELEAEGRSTLNAHVEAKLAAKSKYNGMISS